MKFTMKTAFIGAVALGVTAGASFAQEVTLRCQHFLPPKGSTPLYFMTPWAEKVEKESGGRIKVELYPAMQLGGKPQALYDQIRDGVIDCGWALPAYTPGRFPEAEAFELPFMTSRDAAASSKAAWEFSEKYLMDRMGDVKLLATHVHGPGIVHKKGEPVMALEDFQGLKLRGPSRQANALLETLGASPVGMPMPTFPEALSKGVVDGGVTPWEIVPPLKLHELADSHTEFPGDRSLYNTFFIWAMNKDTYANLPDDLKAVIDANSGLETSGWAGASFDKGDVIGREIVAGSDNNIHQLDPAVVAEIRALGDKQTEAWAADMTSKGLDGEGMVALAKELVEKYSDN
ncbi:TRAP transporter substrate-binding protein [Aliiroseovarius sp. F47248L]|uniref:TRAP transporter substrate-binding protein n=1 Tax=Aliiroseovarius sp. F47248L TaxID=2926420 RepID=UPI001FF10EA3|nr:TRAP transporter substrate-binding protein [Aliiroseovarius sp. F47248L]MCK0138697.1 TRAP transporter substrate-binding protein [Aliiroseovarius sp. F47248L]